MLPEPGFHHRPNGSVRLRRRRRARRAPGTRGVASSSAPAVFRRSAPAASVSISLGASRPTGRPSSPAASPLPRFATTQRTATDASEHGEYPERLHQPVASRSRRITRALSKAPDSLVRRRLHEAHGPVARTPFDARLTDAASVERTSSSSETHGRRRAASARPRRRRQSCRTLSCAMTGF